MYGVYIMGTVDEVANMYAFVFKDEESYALHEETMFDDLMDLFPEPLDDIPETHSFFDAKKGIPYGAIYVDDSYDTLVDDYMSLKVNRLMSKEDEKEEDLEEECDKEYKEKEEESDDE